MCVTAAGSGGMFCRRHTLCNLAEIQCLPYSIVLIRSTWKGFLARLPLFACLPEVPYLKWKRAIVTRGLGGLCNEEFRNCMFHKLQLEYQIKVNEILNFT